MRSITNVRSFSRNRFIQKPISDGVGVIITVLLVVILIAIPILVLNSCGIYGFGPHNTVEATVKNKHVDNAGRASHYMVTTDKGTFEVQNGMMLNTWNADEIYGRIEIGKKYRFSTKGNKVVNPIIQEYPYIINLVDVAE